MYKLSFTISFVILLFSRNTTVVAQVFEIEEILTPNKTIAYSIKTNVDRFYTKTTKLVETNKLSGSQRKLEIEGKEEYGKNLQAIICDNKYLFFVATEDGMEVHEKKKVTEKLVLNRFEHGSLVYTKFVIDTPPIEGGDESCFWSFVGQQDDTKYFSYKRVDEKLSKIEFVVLGVSSEGKVTSTTKFSLTLPTGKFTRPSYNLSEPLHSSILRRLDYRIRVSSNTHGGMRSSFERTIPYPSAHSQVVYDNYNNSFLVYGLYGDKPFKSIGSVYKGLYLSSFDLTGQRVWLTEQPGSSRLSDEGFFRIHGGPGDRNVEVFSASQKKIAFVISFNNVTAPFLFSSEGKLLKSDLIKETKKTSFDINTFIK